MRRQCVYRVHRVPRQECLVVPWQCVGSVHRVCMRGNRFGSCMLVHFVGLATIVRQDRIPCVCGNRKTTESACSKQQKAKSKKQKAKSKKQKEKKQKEKKQKEKRKETE